jgi:hypothetical protein
VGDENHSAGLFFSSEYGGGGGEGGADLMNLPLAPADLGLEVAVAVGTSEEFDARAMRWGGRMSENDALRLRPCFPELECRDDAGIVGLRLWPIGCGERRC